MQPALQEKRGWVTAAPAERPPGKHTPLGGESRDARLDIEEEELGGWSHMQSTQHTQ